MRLILLTAFVLVFSNNLSAQLSATFETAVNTNCLGQPCNYDGPTILINELMISPNTGDGSIIDESTNLGTRRGEWIELYNPNLCEPIDISCYYLGNHVLPAPSGANGFRLPDNLIVPPGGFVLIRGINAPPVPTNQLVQNGGNTIEIVLPPFPWDDGVCSWGNRVWFPNVGGWFAFYDAAGNPQDAVSWANQGGIGSEPCVAQSLACSAVATLPSYDNIPNERKFQATTTSASNHFGQSIRRIPDGGAWSNWGEPTQGSCNSLPCATVGESTCTGTATVFITGGTAPYTYLWNDSQLQMSQTALGLCGTTYEVIVTDATGLTDTFSVDIQNFTPTVSLNVQAEYCVYDNPINLNNFSPVATPNQFSELVGPGVNNLNFDPNVAGVGTHTLTYTFTDENGCTNTAQDSITVHEIPAITLDVTNEYCQNDLPVNISNFTPPINGPIGTGSISGPGVTQAGLGNIIFSPQAAGPGTHTITYNYTSIHGCNNTTTNEIIVYPLPTVNVTLGTEFCAYDPEVDISLSTSPPITGPLGNGVLSGPGVSFNGTSYVFNPGTAGPGIHSINYTFTSTEGCVASDADQITVHNIPDINISADPLEGFVPANITFTNTSNFANDYTWDFGDGNTLNSNNSQITHAYTVSGTYTIILVGQGNGCINSDSIQITLFDPISYGFPNVFSPNGDNSNPFFNLIDVEGFEKVNEFEFIILNRWGNVIRTFNDKYFQWDGKGENGSDVMEGVYFYKLYMTSEFGDIYENHGFFNLVR